MSALKLRDILGEIKQAMFRIAPHRPVALFEKFLIEGYAAITLSSVSEQRFEGLLSAKLCLGTLITLYDDFADRPLQADPQLLEILYRLRFGERPPILRINGRPEVTDFVRSLFAQIESVIETLPNYNVFLEVLNFDLSQFYSANRYSSLVTVHPYLNNSVENRLYTHHNMGMMIVAMIDLMATEKLELTELAAMREVFLLGQRMGRIFNVLVTRRRESLDGDRTGELSCYQSQEQIDAAERGLHAEVLVLGKKIAAFETRIRTFSVAGYLEGLMKVRELHVQMEGTL